MTPFKFPVQGRRVGTRGLGRIRHGRLRPRRGISPKCLIGHHKLEQDSSKNHPVWTKRNKRPIVGGVSIRSRHGASSRKGCVVVSHMTKASNK